MSEPDRYRRADGAAVRAPEGPAAPPPPRRRRRSGAVGGNGAAANEFWAPKRAPSRPDSVDQPPKPEAFIQSLGAPPLPGQAGVADRYLAMVVRRAANLAAALATAAGLERAGAPGQPDLDAPGGRDGSQGTRS